MQLQESISEKQLLEKVKAGDNACFEYLYRKYKGKLYNFILSISEKDFYLAEEIVQNTFLRIWEIRKTMNTDESFSSFLYTISKNMFFNEVKKRAKEVIYQNSLLQQEGYSTNLVEQEVEYKLLEEEINKLIDLLPPARRQIYKLSRQNFHSNKEIAELLHISENTVESNLYKATNFIKKVLASHYNRIELEAMFNK